MSDIERAIAHVAHAYDNGEIPGTLPHDYSPMAKVLQELADERALADDLAADLAWYREKYARGRGDLSMARHRKARQR